ncbi:hypothetical protein [Allomesorhizobium alhagi]|uniref:hypothetical protein n=1 Tax=Allomesorhizobium alhagi TaxID=475067 RepID=UPI0002FA10E2|nr:hypothetical protein [Mesorhizobium alhagi]
MHQIFGIGITARQRSGVTPKHGELAYDIEAGVLTIHNLYTDPIVILVPAS